MFIKESNSSFDSSFLKLLKGSLFAAVITFGCLPVVSRLYSPEDFGLLQSFISIVVLCSVFCSFRYELAIVLPRSLVRVHGLFYLSLFCLLATTLLFCLIIYLFGHTLLIFLELDALIGYLWLFPIGVFCSGLYQILNSINIQKENFTKLSNNTVIQTSVNQVTSIVGGVVVVAPSPLGLLIAYISSLLVASFILLKVRSEYPVKLYELKYLANLACKYKKFPLINTLNNFLNELSIHLPVFMFGKYASAEFVGFYMMAIKLWDMPLNMIMGNARKVYVKYAADAYNDSANSLKAIYRHTLIKLIIVAFALSAGVLLLSDFVIVNYLGGEWMLVSNIMTILIFAKVFQLLNSPLSATFMIVNRQELATLLISVSLIVRFSGMYLFRSDTERMLWILTLTTGGFYMLFNIVMYRSIR